jgi:hypothetical protein
VSALEGLERELAEAVSHRDELPPYHPRRVPLDRRIALLNAAIRDHREAVGS